MRVSAHLTFCRFFDKKPRNTLCAVATFLTCGGLGQRWHFNGAKSFYRAGQKSMSGGYPENRERVTDPLQINTSDLTAPCHTRKIDRV